MALIKIASTTLRATTTKSSQWWLTRAFSTHFASGDKVLAALKDERAIILDVRQPFEIEATGYWAASTPSGKPVGWRHMPCSPSDATLLEITARNLLPDKTAPIVVHCAGGVRSAMAKAVLDELGYEQVLNVGGWQEVQQFNK